MRILLLVFLLAQSAFAASWYVDSSATGSANGTSEANAWTDTSAIVWASVTNGDTVWIKGRGQAGAYGELEIGSNETGITFRIIQDSTEQAVFTFSDLLNVDNSTIDGLIGTNRMFKVLGQTAAYTTSGNLQRLRSCQNLTIRGVEYNRSAMFNTDSSVVNGISVNNSTSPANDFIVIEDCTFIDSRGDHININTSGPSEGFDQYIVRYCNGTRSGDDAVQHSGNTTVEYCHFDKAGQAPLHGGHQDGVQSGIGRKYIRVRHSTFIGYSQCLFIERPAGHVELYNNILRGDGSTTGSQRGIVAGVYDTSSFDGLYLVANNICVDFLTFCGSQHGTLEELIATGYTNAFVGNYIFLNCKTAVQGDGVLNGSNLWWDSPGVQYYDTDGNPVSTPVDRLVGSAVNGDPKFVDAANGDFRIESDSDAIGIGTDFSDFFTVDKAGVTRSSWDAGAYAFDGDPLLPPTITAIGDQTIDQDTSTAALDFTVDDAEDAEADLTLSASSDNPTLIADEGAAFGGSGANRTVTITPNAGQTGFALITITVTDSDDMTDSTTFRVDVNSTSLPSVTRFGKFSTPRGRF